MFGMNGAASEVLSKITYTKILAAALYTARVNKGQKPSMNATINEADQLFRKVENKYKVELKKATAKDRKWEKKNRNAFSRMIGSAPPPKVQRAQVKE